MGNEVQPKVMLTRGCGYTTSLTNASSISHSAVPHGVTTSSRPLTISSTSDPPFGLPEDRRGKWDEMVRRLGLTTWKVDRQTEGNRQRMRRDKTRNLRNSLIHTPIYPLHPLHLRRSGSDWGGVDGDGVSEGRGNVDPKLMMYKESSAIMVTSSGQHSYHLTYRSCDWWLSSGIESQPYNR